MPPFPDHGADPVGAAAALARDIGPDLDSVLLTHHPDADTLDTLRPGETDLATVQATTRAVAKELAAQGVEIFVQLADRAAFRRWMQDRQDTPEVRRRWIDRGRLLRGAAAFRALGLAAPPAPPPPPKLGSAPGPIADRLVAAFDGEDEDAFDTLAQALLEAGRQDVLDLAIRKIGTRHGEEAAEELEGALLAAAEAGRLGPSGWAELVALPVALPAEGMPDGAAMGESLLRAGILAETVEVRFLPGWRAPEAIAALSPGALRRVLLDLLEGAEPRDLPPADTDELAERSFGALIGLQIDWAIPIWDEIAAAEGMPDEGAEDEDGLTPEEARRAALFDGWRGATFEANGGCVPLALVPPSEVDAEIEEFLEEAGAHTAGLEEIRAFVAVARQEAGGEDIVCRPETLDGGGLALALYTERGRFLDALSLSVDRLPAPAEDMPRLIEAFVRVVREVPRR